MNSRDVRRSFLEFFAERGHQVVPSSPLVLPRDPTLLFANAGMNQFKDVFTGVESRPYTRAVSVQKCLRVSGKHNDLEEVGRTPRHHTFFEMLGNFSFGDYFKREAIRWAWELVTEVWRIPPERLHATVFAGDDAFPADEEAARLWESEAGLPAARITALGRKDNFWQMGDTGPAGPCSEIHYDLDPDRGAGDPGTDPDRFLEIWNLVFMQFDLRPGGEVARLPAPSVDTGAGLERLTAVLSGKRSNYDTDLFQPIIHAVAAEAGVRYGADERRDVSLRVISDHLRAITMLVSEGIIPGPEKRGAVLRRILRRALRHGRMLGLPPVFLHRHVGVVVDVLGEAYPELVESRPIVERVVRREEERFERTLAEGFALLEERLDALLAAGERTFPGEEAFALESERGLPADLLRDALEERGVALDEAGYEAARRRHVETSRVLRRETADRAATTVPGLEGREHSRFVGYETERVEAARVVALLGADGRPVAELREGDSGEVVLDVTPFYAESGGQVGDRGVLTGAATRARVLDTRSPSPGLVLHRVQVDAGRLAEGDVVLAEVDPQHRRGARRHHTATHLLHAALRTVLGPHVRQAGSLVAPDRLRFDFAHYEPVGDEDLRAIEEFVNAVVLEDPDVVTEEMPIDEALAAGALAFFGDRYGDRVRVVRVGDRSVELCGGTHVARAGQIGPVRVLQERGIAAGVRRIEAVAGEAALARAREEARRLAEIEARLGGGDPVEALERRLEQLRRLQKENEQLRMRLARGETAGTADVVEIDGLGVIARRADGLSRGQRRDLADTLRQQNPRGVVVLGAEDAG
ncbi:MAG: alanine--tRNA ligase, partial [Acidobacteria bacterium]